MALPHREIVPVKMRPMATAEPAIFMAFTKFLVLFAVEVGGDLHGH